MNALAQTRSVVTLGLRTVPARLGTSMVVVIGVAAVVAVLIAALAIAFGFARAAAATGDPGRAIVLGGDTEAAGSLSRQNAVTVANAPGIATDESGAPVASADALVFVPMANRYSGVTQFATLRGVGPAAFALRPEVEIVEGRTFRQGAQEIIVGRAVQRRLGGLTVGSTISLPNGDWSVVGVFESGGDAHESELMTDVETLLGAYQRSHYNSITVRLDTRQAFEALAAALDADPTLSVNVLREDEYFGAATRDVSRLLTAVAYGIGAIMAFGAAFAALNTMYSAVGARSTEIATLRALGFGAAPVVASVLLEALVLALTGALIGSLAAFVLLDGSSISTMTGITPSQLTFDLRVGLDHVVIGIAFACGIAAVGGSVAAIHAARLGVAEALRMT